MNSPYGSLDNNGGSLAYYCLTPWGEQTAFSGDSGAKDWSQEWIGQEFDYNNISEDAGGGWLVSDESHFGGGQMGDCYNNLVHDGGLQTWHVSHTEPTFNGTPGNYSTDPAVGGAFDMQFLGQVSPFHDKLPKPTKNAVQSQGRVGDGTEMNARPLLSNVPRNLPRLLPNKPSRVGRGPVEHQPAHIDRPNLFASLEGQQSNPPVSAHTTMEHPDQEPKEQCPRFENDLYTARWTRGEGKNRQGWCGYCSSYYTLKDSAYWYDRHFHHGILSEGTRMPDPRDMREGRTTGSWEAQCGSCNRWLALASGKKGRTAYFRHVYKCLTPLKREGSRLKNNGSRKAAASSSSIQKS